MKHMMDVVAVAACIVCLVVCLAAFVMFYPVNVHGEFFNRHDHLLSAAEARIWRVGVALSVGLASVATCALTWRVMRRRRTTRE